MKFFTFLLFVPFLTVNLMAQSFDVNRVMTYFQDQQYDEAIGYLEPFLITDSNNIQLLGYLAYANYVKDDIKGAAAFYEKILVIDSTNISANQNLANIHLNRNEELASSLTKRLIRLQPSRALHYRTMGQILNMNKDKDSALKFFEDAYRLDSFDKRNIAALADILINNESYTRADSLLIRGFAIDSMYIPFLISGIQSAYENDRYEEAVNYGKRLIAQEDLTLKPLSQVILSYYHMKQYQQCIELCDYINKKDATTEAVRYYEAKAWAKLGNYKKSNELLGECLNSALSKTAELYYYALADNYEEMRNYSRAIANYDTAYYLFKDPLVTYNIGRLYQSKLKNTAMADKYFKKYLLLADTSDPEEKKAYNYLMRRKR